jgi:hypothetical protein
MDDLAVLRRDYPGWNFGSVWAIAGSGPDARRLWASRNGVLLSAWTAAELALDINREEQQDPAGHSGPAGHAGPAGDARPAGGARPGSVS